MHNKKIKLNNSNKIIVSYKALRYGAGDEDVAGARPRGRRGRTGVTKGGPHALVRRKRLNSDGEDGTEGRRRGTTVVMWRRRGGGRIHTV
ncbi:hypothetical protein Hanom_Chr03g00224481 [Helianthus anomalus]